MSIFSKTTSVTHKLITLLVVAMLCLSAVPPQAFAQATSTPPTTDVPGCTDDTAINYNAAATIDDGSCEYPQAPEETASSTEETTEEETATSTNDGTDGTDTPTASSTATTTDDGTDGGDSGTATTTDDGSGSEGGSGDDGEGGTGTDVEEEDEGEPIPLISETELGEDSTPDDGVGNTGEIRRTGHNVNIVTGGAVAQSGLNNDVNSNLIRSEITDYVGDLDTYTVNATGTSLANVANDGAAFSGTGENTALSTGVATIQTGNAVSAVNVANIVNSNVINSDGFLYLKNQVLEPGQSLDLGNFFFPDSGEVHELTNDCTLLSCRAEDVEYNFTQTNTATVTNDVVVEAITGENYTDSISANIDTGEARGGANVINVVNTNIIDSHYRLLTYNALGDLDGDLILPTEELFHAFFSRPNGMTQVEPEGIDILIDNDNLADVNNNLDAVAETGRTNLMLAIV